MRKQTELSPNIRRMSFSPRGWGDRIHVGTIQGGANEMMPSALAVLAAGEVGLIFVLVKLSGVAWQDKEPDDEHQTSSADVSGGHH